MLNVIISIILGLILGSIIGQMYIHPIFQKKKGPDSTVIRKKTYKIMNSDGLEECYKFTPIPIVGPIISRKNIT